MNNSLQSTFFLGVVEDVHDPMQINRVRVRVFGKHTEDITLLPTDSLPWYNVLMPVTSASTSGAGQSIGLVNGSWVYGSFIDGEKEQEAIIIGSLSGKSTQTPYTGTGFTDPEGIYPKSTGGDSSQAAGGDAQTLSQPFVTNIPVATPPQLSSLTDDEKAETESISSPDPADWYKPQYPYNNVTESESGHLLELDDTPGKERIGHTHASGTTSQIINDGSKIESIIGEGYTVYNKNNTVYIVGNCNLAVDGDVNMRVGGNYTIDVDGDMRTNVLGKRVTKIGGDDLTEVTGNSDTNISGSNLYKVGLSQTINVIDDQKMIVGGNQINIIEGMKETTARNGQDDHIYVTHNTLIEGKRETSVTGNDDLECLSQLKIMSSNNMKLTCPEKIHINTPIAKIAGDVLAGNGGVSLITHLHTQKDGNDAGGGIDTTPSIGGTGVGA